MANKLKEFKENMKKRMLDKYYEKYVRTTFEAKENIKSLAVLSTLTVISLSMSYFLYGYSNDVHIMKIWRILSMLGTCGFGLLAVLGSLLTTGVLVEFILQKIMKKNKYEEMLNLKYENFNDNIKNHSINSFFVDANFYKDEYLNPEKRKPNNDTDLSRQDIEDLLSLLNDKQKEQLKETLQEVEFFDINEMSIFIKKVQKKEKSETEKQKLKAKFNNAYSDLFNDKEMEYGGHNTNVRKLL